MSFQQGDFLSFSCFGSISEEPKRDPEVQKYRKRLSLRIPGSKFQLHNLKILNSLVRRTLKQPFTKRMPSIKIKTAVFPYYRSSLQNGLQKLTLAQNFFDRGGPREIGTRFPAVFKHLQKLTIESHSGVDYLKSARKNCALKELCVKILENDVPRVSKLFRGLSKLESVDLTISNNSKEALRSNFLWRFLKDLANLKRLRTLKLLMKDCEVVKEASFFDHLMEILSENSSIENLDLILYLQDFEEGKLSEKAMKMLAKIEELQIDFVTKALALPKPPPSEENQESEMRKKVTIYFPAGKNIDIAKVLTSRFWSIKSIKICDPAGFIVASPETRLILPALEIMNLIMDHKESQNVENIIAYLAQNWESPKLNHFEIGFNNFTDGILNELVKLHSSFTLAKIEKYSIVTFDILPWNQVIKDTKIPINMASNDAFDNYMRSFSRFTSLKKLRLATRIKNTLYIKSITRSFDYFKNLLKFQLLLTERDPNVQNGQREAILIELPLYKLENLQSLKLMYRPTLKMQDFMGFLEKMSRLEDLQSFTIESEEIDIKDRKCVERIALIMSKFPKCKRLGIGPRKVGNSGFERKFIHAKVSGDSGTVGESWKDLIGC